MQTIKSRRVILRLFKRSVFMASISSRSFGETKEGKSVTLYRLTNQKGNYVELLDYGCTVHAIVVSDRNSHPVDVCLGYDTIQEYEKNDGYLGAVVGRHANRIAAGKFTLNGHEYTLACNDGPNHLHGGLRGFNCRIWEASAKAGCLTFSRLSPDGEEGYPGNLRISVTYEWSDQDQLSLVYQAECDKDTVLNLTNHTYFNLAGGGTALSHVLQIDADRFTQNDAYCLPTGVILPVKGTMDFRKGKPLEQDMESGDPNLEFSHGYDHNYILNSPSLLKSCASLRSNESGICMDVFTDQPGIQLYSGNFLTERRGKAGAAYHIHDAVCLETQHFPNSLACHFDPPAILRANEKFKSVTCYAFSTINSL